MRPLDTYLTAFLVGLLVIALAAIAIADFRDQIRCESDGGRVVSSRRGWRCVRIHDPSDTSVQPGSQAILTNSAIRNSESLRGCALSDRAAVRRRLTLGGAS